MRLVGGGRRPLERDLLRLKLLWRRRRLDVDRLRDRYRPRDVERGDRDRGRPLLVGLFDRDGDRVRLRGRTRRFSSRFRTARGLLDRERLRDGERLAEDRLNQTLQGMKRQISFH